MDCIARLATPLTISRRKQEVLEKDLLPEPHDIVQGRPQLVRQPQTQLPRVARMTSTRCHLSMTVTVYNMEAERPVYARRQQLLPGTNRPLDPPRCPDLIPQPRQHEAQSPQKSVRRIRTLILRHARTRDREQRLAKLATITTTATTAPSAAERGGVERSNPSSAWGGSFNTPIPEDQGRTGVSPLTSQVLATRHWSI